VRALSVSLAPPSDEDEEEEEEDDEDEPLPLPSASLSLFAGSEYRRPVSVSRYVAPPPPAAPMTSWKRSPEPDET
jgi:hypothetical protein